MLDTLGMNDYRVRVGLRDPDSQTIRRHSRAVGQGREGLPDARRDAGRERSAPSRGEAAFYGPKIDFVVKDVHRPRMAAWAPCRWTTSFPQRFDLTYIGADNTPHRPVMIHRAPFGSMERFVGVLIEHFAGAFPLWLAPVQVAVLSISEKFQNYAGKATEALKAAGIRAEADLSPEKIGAKIRSATLAKVPYMLVVGSREAESNAVAVRTRTGGDQGSMPLDDFIKRCQEEIANRTLLLPEKPAPAGT